MSLFWDSLSYGTRWPWECRTLECNIKKDKDGKFFAIKKKKESMPLKTLLVEGKSLRENLCNEVMEEMKEDLYQKNGAPAKPCVCK